MIKRLLSAIGINNHMEKRQLPGEFFETGAEYVSLVKSRIIGSVVVDSERLLFPTASPEIGFGLLAALSTYFSVRTDLELKDRGIPQSIRDEFWPLVPDAVLEEMEFEGDKFDIARQTIIAQMDVMLEVLDYSGRDNSIAIAQTLFVFMTTPKRHADWKEIADKSTFEKKVYALLKEYDRYSYYLDTMADLYNQSIK